jgi:hypothetical protein
MKTTRTTRRGASSVLVPLLAAGLMFAAAGCGGDDDSTSGDDQASEASTAGTTPSAATDADTGSDEASAEGLCVAVTSVDLTAAFGGELEFGEAKDSASRETCIVPIVGAEGEGLIVKVTTAENYAQLALYEDQGVPFRQIEGLGEEAFILNDADLNVLLADGTAVQVAVQAFFVSGSPPDPSTIEPGLVAVAEAVIASP